MLVIGASAAVQRRQHHGTETQCGNGERRTQDGSAAPAPHPRFAARPRGRGARAARRSVGGGGDVSRETWSGWSSAVAVPTEAVSSSPSVAGAVACRSASAASAASMRPATSMRHPRWTRNRAQQSADLLERGVDVGTELAPLQMLANVVPAVRREETFSEVGDLRDVRVLRLVGRRRHARPPPPFTAAGSFGPVSGGSGCRGPAAGGTDVPLSGSVLCLCAPPHRCLPGAGG